MKGKEIITTTATTALKNTGQADTTEKKKTFHCAQPASRSHRDASQSRREAAGSDLDNCTPR